MQVESGPSMLAVEALLRSNDLPIADLSALQSSDFLFCGQSEKPIGVIGIQILGSVGLLRSLVVSDIGRNHGCGTALVEALESKAKHAGIKDLYLLTETAEAFFANLNYTKISRDGAPSAIKNTQEFDGLCPDDAILMHKQLVIGN